LPTEWALLQRHYRLEADALQALQAEGLIAHLGVAGGPIELLRRYMRTGAFAVVLTHNRFSLVDQSAEPLLTEAQELGVAVLNAAPFGGGVLAGAPQSKGFTDIGRRTPRSSRGSRRWTPRAALTRCGSRPPRCSSRCASRVVSTIAGASRPERIDRMLELAGWSIPPELWDELRRLN
jgi:D-threo-aldose 1-dehydrogenase